jgi:serine/threonine protein kinase
MVAKNKLKLENIVLQEIKSILYEPIIDINSSMRYVNGVIVESDKKLQDIISQKYINAIKKVVDLQGEGGFLGQGSRGSAYKFNNKVLKITNDGSEAAACNKIIGKKHPNVYNVYLVRKLPKTIKALNIIPFIIVYEYLEFPNRIMADVASQLETTLKYGVKYFRYLDPAIMFYGWKDEYKNRIIELGEQINNSLTFDFDKKMKPEEKFVGLINKNNLNWSKEDMNIFWSMFRFFCGYFCFENYESFVDKLDEMIGSDRFDYFCQLASGLTFLKDNGIHFDDLKRSNIMQKDGQLVIIDIGYSKVEGHKDIKVISEAKFGKFLK